MMVEGNVPLTRDIGESRVEHPYVTPRALISILSGTYMERAKMDKYCVKLWYKYLNWIETVVSKPL